MIPDTSESLIHRLKDPESTEAWNEFFTLYQPLLVNYFVKCGIERGDSEDLSQDVLLRIAKSAGGFTFDPEKGKFRSWLFTIARNIKNTYFSRQYRDPKLTSESVVLNNIPGPEKDTHEEYWNTEYRRHIFRWACQQIRKEASPKAWDIFWGSTVDEESVISLAEKHDISVGAAYAAKSRVAALVRAEIQRITGDIDR